MWSAKAPETLPRHRDITIGKTFSITSEILGEERAYWVYLPQSYDSPTFVPRPYPVLYLLDGDAHFHSASGVVQFMSTFNFQIPELIIVAIPNTDRTRDLTPTHTKIGEGGKEETWLKTSGGGNTFLKFIRDELFPHIDSTYRTLPYRILVGHSLGGLLALHALLEMPETFQAYMAFDPSLWWDDQVLVHNAESRFTNAQNRRGTVYISLANHSDLGVGNPTVMENAARAFAASLEHASSSGFRSILQYFKAEDHGSVPLQSLYHGLLYIFPNFKPSANFFKQPSILNTHFERVSEQLGVVLPPPEAFVNTLGYGLIEEDVTKAIAFFKLNVSNYPDSYNVYDSLGEAYMANGEVHLAIHNNETSLTLNPANQNAQKRLQALRAQEARK